MKKTIVYMVSAFAAAAACGDWVYEGGWGSEGRGDGEFYFPRSVACAPGGNV